MYGVCERGGHYSASPNASKGCYERRQLWGGMGKEVHKLEAFVSPICSLFKRFPRVRGGGLEYERDRQIESKSAIQEKSWGIKPGSVGASYRFASAF